MAYIVSSPPVSPRASAAASMFFSIFGASVSLDLSEELLSLPPQAVNARSRTMERRMVMIFFIVTSSSFENKVKNKLLINIISYKQCKRGIIR